MIRTVDYSADVGYYSSIDVDNTGKVHIAYYDATNKALKYAQGVISGGDWVWTIETVDDNAAEQYDVGKYASIGVNNNGVPFISYYDAIAGNLKLANKPTGNPWLFRLSIRRGCVVSTHPWYIDSLDIPILVITMLLWVI
jgi:hypothetical protein